MRPCSERVDHDVEPDEIFPRKIEQIFYDLLCGGDDFVALPADETRHFIPAGDRLRNEKSPLFSCRAYDGYLFHNNTSQKIFDVILSITTIV